MPIQYNQIVDDVARSKIGSLAKEELDNQMTLIDDKFENPLEITLSSDTISIGASVITKKESNNSDSTQNAYKWRIPLFNNNSDISVSASTLNLTNGDTTGSFINDPETSPTMTASYYVQMGIELRYSGGLYTVFGTQASSSGATTAPIFTPGSLQLAIVKLRDSGGGGTWNFNTPAKSDVEIIKNSYPKPKLQKSNFIINGNFTRWQRGLSTFVNPPNATITSDRWGINRSDDAAVNVGVETSILPPVNDVINVLKVSCTTADASIGAGQYYHIYQRIEGRFAKRLFGKPMTMSFWVRSSKTGVYGVSFHNSTFSRAYVKEITINSANTWEFKKFTLTHDMTGTWDNGGTTGIQVSFALAFGSTYHGTANQWTNSNIWTTSNQVNWLDSNTATFYLSQVQLLDVDDEDSSFVPFENSETADLDACLRYFQKSYSPNTNPGTVTTVGMIQQRYNGGVNMHSVYYKVLMRAPTAVTLYSPSTGASGVIYNQSTAADVASSVPADANESSFYPILGAAQTLTNSLQFHWTASAEI